MILIDIVKFMLLCIQAATLETIRIKSPLCHRTKEIPCNCIFPHA